MRRTSLLAIIAALSAASASAADAQSRGVGGGFRHLPLPQPPIVDGFFGFPGVYVFDRVQVIEREIIKEVPVAPPPEPPPPPPPRKPYKIGELYDSLPSPCMKMIEGGESYYLCSGDWYRQAGAQYVAVKAP